MTAETRETVRCAGCGLVQFDTKSGDCRKCGKPLHPAPGPVTVTEAVVPIVRSAPADASHDISAQIATRVRQIRDLRGLSQRQAAARMNVPRTYFSKVEQDRCTPGLDQLGRIAQALQVPVIVLVMDAVEFSAWLHDEAQHQPFFRELLAALPRLSAEQRQLLLQAAVNMLPQRLRGNELMLRRASEERAA